MNRKSLQLSDVMPVLFFSSLDERGNFTGWFSYFSLETHMPGYALDNDQKKYVIELSHLQSE